MTCSPIDQHSIDQHSRDLHSVSPALNTKPTRFAYISGVAEMWNALRE
jgi:hypothetical protein